MLDKIPQSAAHEFQQGDRHALPPLIGLDLLDQRSLLCDGGDRYGCTYYDDAWLAGCGIEWQRSAEHIAALLGQNNQNTQERGIL